LSRFAFYIPDPTLIGTTHFCYCNNNEEERVPIVARFADATNSSFTCTRTPETWKLNSTVEEMNLTTNVTHAGSLLQTVKSVHWEVGIYPASKIQGDVLSGPEVGEEIVHVANSPAEPERYLLRNGTWLYKAGLGVKFLGLFPATFATWPGHPYPAPKETSLNLGPNPGGHGGLAATTLPPSFTEEERQLEEDKAEQESLQYVDSVLHKAEKINTQVTNSIEELSSSMYRAARAHAAVMNYEPYRLPDDLN
jgi:hypothetical protein